DLMEEVCHLFRNPLRNAQAAYLSGSRQVYVHSIMQPGLVSRGASSMSHTTVCWCQTRLQSVRHSLGDTACRATAPDHCSCEYDRPPGLETSPYRDTWHDAPADQHVVARDRTTSHPHPRSLLPTGQDGEPGPPQAVPVRPPPRRYPDHCPPWSPR